MAGHLYRLGAFGARRARWVLLGWLLVLAAVAGLGVTCAGSFQTGSSVPGSQAQAALTRMDRDFHSKESQSARIVFQAPSGHRWTDADLERSLHSSLAAMGRVAGVTAVSTPPQNGMVSPDGRMAVADVEFKAAKDTDVPAATLNAVKAAGHTTADRGVKAVYGGDAFKISHSPVGPTEMIGLGVALLVLLITFGSLLAAGLPLLTAVIGVVGTLTAMIGLSSAVGISDNALTLAVMLGLAVGIDYALFIVSRHRAQLSAGMPVQKSIAQATATAGSAVVFAGATVIVALAGLSVAGVPMLTSMGLASAGAVTTAVLLALSLLPALLALAGRRLSPKPGSRAARRATHTRKQTLGMKWAVAVTRHPVRWLVGVTAALLLAAIPALQIQTALTDDGSEAKTASTRQAYDMISKSFGPGANGPLIVLIENNNPATVTATTATVTDKVDAMHGIATVSRADVADDGTAARIQIIPTTGPRTQQTSDLVSHLRTAMNPIARSSDSYVAVTGQTAVSIDVSDKLRAAQLPFVLVVVGLSLLLLLVAFRSVAIPFKATAGFLLSLMASFGSTVAIFQWGWLAGLLGVPSQGPLASFVPIIVMAVLFGLAMDYEVFMVSAMREDYRHRHDAHGAIIAGARNASRVVTAAALIMTSVFVSFLFSKDPAIMPIAFALAIGVAIDAFLVRMTLVPAVLTLLGDRAWKLPRRLDRILPHLDVEGGDFQPTDTPSNHVDLPAQAPATQ